jgi:hypothetical protein
MITYGETVKPTQTTRKQYCSALLVHKRIDSISLLARIRLEAALGAEGLASPPAVSSGVGSTATRVNALRILRLPDTFH